VRLGITIPQNEIGTDPGQIGAWAQDVEGLGFDYLDVFDHVLGADTRDRSDGPWPYGHEHRFHEPFVLYGFLAGKVELELAMGVLVLPQRQTALVAKQAAEVDLLTDGRFRLGVGIGWNAVEYEALGASFTARGRRMSEQIPLLRRLLSEPVVTHAGEFEHITGAGLAPLPRQRPIPIWIGGQSAPAYRRIGRLADGWFPQVAPGPQLEEALAIINDAALEAGRDPAHLGMEGRVSWSSDGVAKVVDHVGRWREAGATHLSINTMNAGLGSVDHHLEVLARIAASV